MSYDEDEEVGEGFKISGDDEDEPLEPLDMPEEMPEIDDDPDDRYH